MLGDLLRKDHTGFYPLIIPLDLRRFGLCFHQLVVAFLYLISAYPLSHLFFVSQAFSSNECIRFEISLLT
jgi:hypothetical protein